MSPTGPFYAGTATNVTVTGNNWSPLSAATGPADGVYATAGEPTGGAQTDNLVLSNYGFNLPDTAVIDGILVGVAGSMNQSSINISLNIGGATKNGIPTGDVYADGLFGSSTDLWGNTSITYSQVNNTNFGVTIQGLNTHGGGSASIDSVEITIYWHTKPAKIPRTKYYLYKVYDSITGSYLGNLPLVSNDFELSQDINTAGTNITVECAVSADTSGLPADQLTDEAGNVLTDENNNILTDEGQTPYTGIGTSNALIRNGNRVQVWEYSYYYPNGKCMFRGVMERGTDNFGGDTGDNNVQIIIYPDGTDLANHIVKAGTSSYTLDQSQTAQNASATISETSGKGISWNLYGQTFTVGTGVTNLGAISLLLNGTANVIVTVYTDPTLTTQLTQVTQAVSVGSATEIQFTFPSHITVTPGTQYFFTVDVGANQNITIYYDTANPYAGGQMYNSNYGGGSGGGAWGPITGDDLYFKTFSTTGGTVATFTNLDPTTGMLVTFMGDYLSEGGKIQLGNIQATGLTLSYGFNTNTTYDGIAAMLTVSPSGFYYYVDLGTDLLYFQQANTTADFKLIKGVHINQLKIVRTTEYVINACYVVGGKDPSNPGYNIYTYDSDAASIARYGVHLYIHTDNNIPNTTTAHQVGQSFIRENKNEQYQTQVTIVDLTMDITQLVPGKIIGFTGFGTYVDGLLAQIVHRDYTPSAVTLTLGILPKRQSTKIEQAVRGLTALNTITNPTSPS